MLSILSHTPLYVWGVLTYVLFVGIKASRGAIVSWKRLVVLPALFVAWSIYVIIAHYQIGVIWLWGISVLLGTWLGTLTVRSLHLRFDKKKHLVAISGTWIPLFLALAIFSMRYFLGASYAINPTLLHDHDFLALENLTALLSGMFVGRLVGYWQRYRKAKHVNL